jgi:hypothetical protein
MPFSGALPLRKGYTALGRNELDTVFGVFKSVLSRHGYLVKRSDSAGDILADIVYELDRAELVCADLTSLNPNVMYELGIRHGFTKKTILLTQDLDEVPFDLRQYHCIKYGWKTDAERRALAAEVKATLLAIEGNPATKFGPVHSHLGAKHLGLVEEEKRTTVSKLEALGMELLSLHDRMVSILAFLKEQHPDAFRQEDDVLTIDPQYDQGEECAPWVRLQDTWSPVYPSIDLLLATRYIPSGFGADGNLFDFYHNLGGLRFSMSLRNKTTSAFLSMYFALAALLQDEGEIAEAVRNDQFGTPRNLRSTVFLRGYYHRDARA